MTNEGLSLPNHSESLIPFEFVEYLRFHNGHNYPKAIGWNEFSTPDCDRNRAAKHAFERGLLIRKTCDSPKC